MKVLQGHTQSRSVSCRAIASLLVSALTLLALSGCNYQRFKASTNPLRTGPTGPSANEPVSFEQLRAEVFFSPYCVRCHGPGGKQIPLQQYDQIMDYVEPGKPDESYLIELLESGEMPPGPNKLPAELLTAIRTWIANGATEK